MAKVPHFWPEGPPSGLYVTFQMSVFLLSYKEKCIPTQTPLSSTGTG